LAACTGGVSDPYHTPAPCLCPARQSASPRHAQGIRRDCAALALRRAERPDRPRVVRAVCGGVKALGSMLLTLARQAAHWGMPNTRQKDTRDDLMLPLHGFRTGLVGLLLHLLGLEQHLLDAPFLLGDRLIKLRGLGLHRRTSASEKATRQPPHAAVGAGASSTRRRSRRAGQASLACSTTIFFLVLSISERMRSSSAGVRAAAAAAGRAAASWPFSASAPPGTACLPVPTATSASSSRPAPAAATARAERPWRARTWWQGVGQHSNA